MNPTPEPTSPFLAACRGLPTRYTPVWLMRQAGRYMAEYRAIRARHSMLDLIRTPELAAEVTLQPVNAFDLDAAIIFSDILPPLMGMGLKLDFLAGEGPQISNPISRAHDIHVLATPPAQESMPGTLKAIALVAAELAPRNIPLIGFAGAPFTLASYAIEGGTSRSFIKVKSLMYSEPLAWQELMTKLVTVQCDYLLEQVKAGASALQIFDSWAGLALSKQDYERYVAPYNAQLFAMLSHVGAPVINFSMGTAAFLEVVAATGGDVIGIDWRMPLDWAWQQIGFNRPIQGNLDPVTLLTPWCELKLHIDDILDRAGGRPGHIFNLGHGIFPQTPVDNVRRLVDYLHERTARDPVGLSAV